MVGDGVGWVFAGVFIFRLLSVGVLFLRKARVKVAGGGVGGVLSVGVL